MERWQGKVAIVTGASSGIGATIAEALVNQGVTVLAVGRMIVRLFGLKEKVKNAPGKMHVKGCDVTEEDDILSVVAWAKKNLGGVDILINSAGHYEGADITHGDTANFQKILDVNVLAVAVFTREVVASMKERNVDGHIININSVDGHKVPNVDKVGMFACSKFAVTALTEVVRKELISAGTKIKITSISPGAVDTPLLEAQIDSVDEEKCPLTIDSPRLNTSDVADSVLYVLSTPPHVQITELTVRPVGEPYH